MKNLFIYYSNTGNGDFVAELFKQNEYEIRKVKPKKELPVNFFFKVLTGGFIAGLNMKSKLVDYDENVEGYDNIVIGSPIWNGRLSCPINTVLKKTDLTDKTLSFVLYSGSGDAKKAEKRLRKNYPSAKIIILQEPKKNMENLKNLKDFLSI